VTSTPASSEGALRALPSVDRLVGLAQAEPAVAAAPRALQVTAAREVIEAARTAAAVGQGVPPLEELAARAAALVARGTTLPLRRVINATGVIIHTNLGRAPLARDALDAIANVARGYSNLEYDLAAGERGSRHALLRDLLVRLSGAEDALVVNNNAAALLLALTALARRREVVIARSQLVEIGGGFRVPDVMRESGARLVEVGTTNRTYLRDYEAACGPRTAALLRVHASNFRIVGFTHETTLAELAGLARRLGVPLIDDLGSGSFLDTTEYGLAHEPMVQESVAGGADLTCFSGDKLLGGPQAGIIVGRRVWVERLRHHPLARALRPDKVILAGLAATLVHYLRGEAPTAIPVWRMIATPVTALEERAGALAARLGDLPVRCEIREDVATVGGGSLPGETLPTRVLLLIPERPRSGSAQRLLARLRAATPAVVGRVVADACALDLRTVLPEEDGELLQAIRSALAGRAGAGQPA